MGDYDVLVTTNNWYVVVYEVIVWSIHLEGLSLDIGKKDVSYLGLLEWYEQ